jgi:hypothetical protein
MSVKLRATRPGSLHSTAGKNAASLDAAGEHVTKLPATFADYLKFITRVLEDNSEKRAALP